MISLYKDAKLTLPITQSAPKKFVLSKDGGTKISTIYLADTSYGTVVANGSSGASTVSLNTVDGFPSAGTATINSTTFNYTSITNTSSHYILGGVTGAPTVTIGDVCVPADPWVSTSSGAALELFSFGNDLNNGIFVAFSVNGGNYGLAGMPAILSTSLVPRTMITIGISVTVLAGDSKEFSNWGLSLTPVKRNSTDGVVPVLGHCYLNRSDTGPSFTTRLLASNRQVATSMPGFLIGKYRWRDNSTRNATAFLPTRWDQDVNTIGIDKFIAGIGVDDDLEPVSLVSNESSVYLNINHGAYFTGVNRYYLPAATNLQFISSSPIATPPYSISYQLPTIPKLQTPIFVGTWTLDNEGFYDTDILYRYECTLVNPDNSNRTDLPEYYFTLNRTTNTITLNKGIPDAYSASPLFIGILSGNLTDYFDLPIYPINKVSQVFAVQAAVEGYTPVNIYSSNFTFSRQQGTLQITNTSGSGLSSIPGALPGQAVYAICSSAVAILYEEQGFNERLLNSVNLNPAYSGISSGYVYLQHTRKEPVSLILSCDKPLINIPATLSSILGLIAYGPVYYDVDYALLTVTAYGAVPNETIPNAELKVVPGPNWAGLINNIDPTSQTVTVTTGADGSANLIFTPPPSTTGVWVPITAATIPMTDTSLGGTFTITLTNDSLVLPDVVPISQIYDGTDWLVNTYSVINDDPTSGSIVTGAPVAWLEVGTLGTSTWRTNGSKVLWTVGTVPILPINVYDVAGHSHTSLSFSGNVKYIQYGQSLPSVSNIAAYFITYTQRVTLQLEAINSNVISNTIMLQCGLAPIINVGWLILDDLINGVLNQYRLGLTNTKTTGV